MKRILPLLLLLSACAPPRQIVEITNRPPPTESGEPASVEAPLPLPYAGEPFKRFDGGKMWTFDAPPLAYFSEAYGFTPDSAWFAHARGAALRFATYCSAAFVSAQGLVMTNHHCGRESITKVSRDGEKLLDVGFVAASLEEERKVKGLFVDQLVSIEDITAEVYGSAVPGMSGLQQAEARQNRAEAIQKRRTFEASSSDSSLVVQVISLYDGGRYAAYTFRRFSDVRLVAAPELQLGFFGGDWDNFTYPRYSLDVSFFRVYDNAGNPYRPQHWFAADPSGAEEGEPVFVVGNPGSTTRLATVTQLEYERDVELPHALEFLQKRADLLDAYIASHPEEAEKYDLRNASFSLSNTIKSTQGQLRGLRSDWLIPRKGGAEAALRHEIRSSDSLRALYDDVFEEIGGVDRAKRASAKQAGAFAFFPAPDMSSHILARSLYAYVYTVLMQRGASGSQLEEIQKEGLQIKDRPADIEKAFLAARLEELREALGPNDPTMRRLFADSDPVQLATMVVDSTALADSAGFAQALDGKYLASGDASVELILAVAPLYFTLSQQLQNFEQQESYLNAKLARARLAIHGTTIPPDASFSLRIADGVVSGYRYNGTEAPAFTTYFGLYDRQAALGSHSEWALPDRWLAAPEAFDRSTPLNLVTTNDITGGNSGSPLLDRALNVIGLVFDSNIEALPNEYLYTDDSARTVSVDIRGIIEALDHIYDADRIVAEFARGEFYGTESEADAH